MKTDRSIWGRLNRVPEPKADRMAGMALLAQSRTALVFPDLFGFYVSTPVPRLHPIPRAISPFMPKPKDVS